jgi:Zn-dependent M28 family amino/carboxypeptidase
LTDDPLPHTGGLRYSTATAKIPAAALSTRDANYLSRLIKENPGLRVHLDLGARSLPPVVSHNVIAELKGREKPDEIVVIGGHLDSWDLGPGAHDDGAGVVESIEALRALKASGARPRRTARAVLFMSEEEGGFGGREYAKQAHLLGERHTAAIETDRGGFAPLGFSASTETLRSIAGWKPYLALSGAGAFFPGGTGTDTEPLEDQGVPSFELIPESFHYFDYHHAARDTLSAVDPKELRDGAAAMAAFAYVAAELDAPATPNVLK